MGTSLDCYFALDTRLLVKIEFLLDTQIFARAEYISLTMVSVMEMLLTSPQSNRHPKRGSIPRLWVPSEVY